MTKAKHGREQGKAQTEQANTMTHGPQMEHKPLWPKLTLQECRERIQTNPKDLEARLILGMAYRLQGDYAAAIETWKGILAIDPTHDPAKQLIRSLQAELMKINFSLQ